MAFPAPVYYNDYNIRRFSMGAVVQSRADGPAWRLIGHVKGFSMNEYNELLVIVDFCNGTTETIHHCHLSFPGNP